MIRKLAPLVIAKIAAGEVIDRPVSIIKELAENSLDAGSTSLSIEISNGGISEISVADNGAGISELDLPLTTELHATSKLTEITDLDNIGTLGFRGEALASISAAADVELISKTADAAALSFSPINGIQPASRTLGTTVVVRNLFRKIPARLKFLKSPRSEELAIRNLVRQLAFIHPQVKFSYKVDGKQILNFEEQSIVERFSEVFQKEAVDFYYMNINGVTGFLGKQKTASSRPEQIIVLNGRLIKSTLIASAVRRAYEGIIPPELRPSFYLQLNFPSSEVDVNVHPRKEEVRFSDEHAVFGRIFKTVQDFLAAGMRTELAAKFQNINQNLQSYTGNSSPAIPFINSSSAFVPSYGAGKSNQAFSVPSQERMLPMQDNTVAYNTTPTSPANFLQIFRTYIVTSQYNAQNTEEVLIVDQHAAAERVMFERVKKQLETGALATTPLLLADYFEVKKKDFHPNELITALAQIGFETELFEENTDSYTLKLTAIPAILQQKRDLGKILTEMTTEFTNDKIDLGSINKKIDLICATVACHGSIRAGQSLTTSEMQQIITDLLKCENPFACPHGRPTVINLTTEELENKFLRRK